MLKLNNKPTLLSRDVLFGEEATTESAELLINLKFFFSVSPVVNFA
jgi:hypothetical protein